jgi:hypothetical protein
MSVLFHPMPLQKRVSAFDDGEYIFDLELDGFRALAVIERARAQMVSRNGHPFASFTDLASDIAATIPDTPTVLDSEIVGLDKQGKPQFRDLLFHRGIPCFFAFGILFSNGKDWRTAHRSQAGAAEIAVRATCSFAGKVSGPRRWDRDCSISASVRAGLGRYRCQTEVRPIHHRS